MTTLLILTLATWRLSSLLADEDGPFAIFERLRLWAGVRYDEYSLRAGTTELARGLLCLWCVSLWTGMAITAVLALARPHLFSPAEWLALPFALSAGAIAIERWTRG